MEATEIERLVAKHGERYRRLIADSLGWLDTRSWATEDFDREAYVDDLVERAQRSAPSQGADPPVT